MFIVRRTYIEEEEEEGRVSRGWRSIGIRAWRERGGTQWVRREGYHIFTGMSSFKMFIRHSLTLYLFSATRSLHSRLWSLAVWSDMLPVVYMSVCVCVKQCEWSLCFQVYAHAAPWLSFDFINYKALSFIQVLSADTYLPCSSLMPSFSLVSLSFCFHSSSFSVNLMK